MKKISTYIGIVFCLMLLVQPVLATDCGNLPACSGDPDATWEVPDVNCCPVAIPFDGGITLMLAAGGIGMGVKAMRKRKNSGQ